jgi:hypothetical protein
MHANKRADSTRKRNARKDLAIAVAIVTAGMAMPGIFLMQLAQGQSHPPQVTSPQTTPVVPAGKQNGPADAKPGGTRPTTPAPEPAQPDADAQKAGVQPALPPAPAEETAPPIKEK